VQTEAQSHGAASSGTAQPVATEARPRPPLALGARLAEFFGRKQLLEGTLEELEEILLTSDVGYEVTSAISEAVREKLRSGEIRSRPEIKEHLRQLMVEALEARARGFDYGGERPALWLVVGVNGAGKTTTVAKLAHMARAEGRSVLIAAADTFRAAAIDQLKRWGDRIEVPVVSGAYGADPAAVVFDAIAAARARNIDLVVADTAGRMHTRQNLMDELGKIPRVAAKAGAPPAEVLLVIDATTGQNGIRQAEVFGEAVPLTGVVLTKMDGTAKGGIAFAVTSKFGLPVKAVGVGEGPSDLKPFDPERFVDELLSASESQSV
jgi:fused signal recognition particle receptor